VEAIAPVHEPPGLTRDERATVRPTAGHERPARAAAGHEGAASGRLTGDHAAPAATHPPATSLRESGRGEERDTRQEREEDGPDGRTLDHHDASTARDGRSLRSRRPVVKQRVRPGSAPRHEGATYPRGLAVSGGESARA
jgi:hypothetical protein